MMPYSRLFLRLLHTKVGTNPGQSCADITFYISTLWICHTLNRKRIGRLVLFFGLIGMGAFIFLNMDLAHRKRDLYLLFAISLIFFISGWVGLFRYTRFWAMLE